MAAVTSHTLDDVLNDLCTRFLINIPDEDLQDGIRIFFVIEQAHWFYDDYFRAQDPSLPRMKFVTFAQTILSHWPPFHHLVSRTGEIYNAWTKYKRDVPVCGALILNPQCTKVVMVRSWGSNPIWGFPKGKINDKESKLTCAIREVYEETGFDIKEYTNESDFIEIRQRRQDMTLFIAAGVPEDTYFEPQARNEISKIRWFKINNVISEKSKEPIVCVAPQVGKQLKTWLSSTDNGRALRQRLVGSADVDTSRPSIPSIPSIPSTLDGLLQALQGGPALGDAGKPDAPVLRMPHPPVDAPVPALVPWGPPGAPRTPGANDAVPVFAFDRARIMQHFSAVSPGVA